MSNTSLLLINIYTGKWLSTLSLCVLSLHAPTVSFWWQSRVHPNPSQKHLHLNVWEPNKQINSRNKGLLWWLVKELLLCNGDWCQLFIIFVPATLWCSRSRKIGVWFNSPFSHTANIHVDIDQCEDQMHVMSWSVALIWNNSSWVSSRLVRFISCLLHLTYSTFLNTSAATL